MIDTTREPLLFLGSLAQTILADNGGRPPGPGTLTRWARHGIQGVRLETVRVGGRLASSKEALARFFDAVTNARTGNTHSAARCETKKATPAEKTKRALDRIGIS